MGRLEVELEDLKQKIEEMSEKLIQMTHDAVQSVVTRNSALAQKVIDMDDDIDLLDSEIDYLSTKILGLYEPKADDLRYTTATLSSINDLERVGDLCVDIAKEAIKINRLPQIKPFEDMPKMGDQAEWMLHEAFQALFNKDAKKALEIIKEDDVVDAYNSNIISELVGMLNEDLQHNQVAVSLIYISRCLERIADYATNICEICYFISEGKRIKHVYMADEDNA